MLPYLRLGHLPRKRHIAHRRDGGHRNEGIYYEEVVTTAGFGRAYSICYHLRPPTRVKKIEPAGEVRRDTVSEQVLRHHHLKSAQVPPGGDSITGRVPVLLNDDVVHALRIRPDQIDVVARREQEELTRREAVYRSGRPLPELKGRTVILVDDGLATGSTMKAAVHAVKQQQPARVIVAVPVGAPETCRALAAIADQVICARTPLSFSAVGQWYRDFTQTTDAEVLELLSSGHA